MDGLEVLKNVVLIAATNRPDLLDPALLRSGRFGRHIEIPLPDKISRIKIFKIHLQNRPIDLNVKIDELALKLEGYTGADIKGICEEATILAIRRGIYEAGINENNTSTFEKVKITKEDFEKAIEKITKDAKKAKMSYEEDIKEPSLYG
jgi:transitional endoplasmic reticulum ATPase